MYAFAYSSISPEEDDRSTSNIGINQTSKESSVSIILYTSYSHSAILSKEKGDGTGKANFL